MGDEEQPGLPTYSDTLVRWDHNLLNRRFQVKEERPPLSKGAKALDARDNLKRHRTFSTDYTRRGFWQKQAQKNKPTT